MLIEDVAVAGAPASDPAVKIDTLWVARDAAFAAAYSAELPALQAASLLAAYAHLGWLNIT